MEKCVSCPEHDEMKENDKQRVKVVAYFTFNNIHEICRRN